MCGLLVLSPSCTRSCLVIACVGAFRSVSSGAVLCAFAQRCLLGCTAWMITYAIMLTIISLAVTVVCCASFLRASDPSLLLLLLLFFAASELAFGLLVASVFSNAKIAGIVAPLAHFACLMPRYIFFRSEAPQVHPSVTLLWTGVSCFVATPCYHCASVLSAELHLHAQCLSSEKAPMLWHPQG